MNAFTGILATALAAMLLHGTAHADSPLRVETQAATEQMVVDDDGVARTRLVPAATIVPGDEIVYTISFTNTGAQEATGVVITDPVPEEMKYIADTAFGPGTRILFSLDGERFAEAAELTVTLPDGGVRPARPDEYTHIQWRLQAPLAPGNRGIARFRAQLR